jgi:phytoene desaturase
MTRRTALIIGAGYGGIALANLLGKAGYAVTVVEKNAAPGGRISVAKQDGYTFDLGPSWYLMPEVFEQYYQIFAQSATERLELVRFTPGYKVYFEGHEPVEIQGDVVADQATFEAIEPGAGKALARYVARSTTAYTVAVNYFLYNNFLRLRDMVHPVVLRHSWSLLRLTIQNLDRYVSRQFRDLRLRQLLEYHMVFLGSSPFQAPAIYTLMSYLDFTSGVYYPKKGMYSLVQDMQALGESYDITYRMNADVREVIVENDAAVGVRLADGEELRADIVISNADLHHTETSLLPAVYQSFPARYWRTRQPGPGALLISLGVKGALPDLLHHNLYFVRRWRENFDAIYQNKTVPKDASIYLCNPTKTDPKLAPKGHENLFILMPIPAGVILTAGEQERLVERTIRTVAKAIGVADLPERIVSRAVFGPEDFSDTFHAWQYNAFGGESHLLSQSVLFRTPNKSRRVRNLYYVGAGTVPGIGLPMCLISAQLTYKRIVGSRRAGPLRAEDVG